MSTQSLSDPDNPYEPRPAVHRYCGLALVKVDLAAGDVARNRAGYFWLNPLVYPGKGDVTLTECGAVLGELGEGDRLRHRCPGRPLPCNTCGQPTLILHREPGAPYALAFLEPEPADDGDVIVDADGVAWVDPSAEYDWDGPRYRRHVHPRLRAAARPARNVTVLGRAAA